MNNLSTEELQCFKRLSKRQDIVFCKPDKGKGIFVLNKCDYVKKLNNIVSDPSKFKLLPDDPTEKRESSLQRYLRLLFSKGIFSREIYDKIRPVGSNPSRIYGLPKLHKKDVPLRPIVSGIGSYTHGLAKYLSDILKPLAYNEFTIKDSFSFANDMLSISSAPFMCSFDVVSLYTNIPVDEAIDICLNKLYCNDEIVYNLTRSQFKKLLNYCVKQNHFAFNDNIYDQIDGVAMGSPLGPILANIFMSHLESTALHKFHGNKPIYYKRYVDDTFLIFSNEQDSISFFEHMNCQHPNISFTIETENDDCLPFLDVLVSRKDGSLETSVYRKSTFSGLYMKYDSFVPAQFRHSLINGLFSRAWRLCSSSDIFQNEITYIKQLLTANGFPYHIINKLLKRFLKSKSTNSISLPKFGPERKPVFLFLPFCGNNSLKLKRQLERLMNNIAPWTKLYAIFKPSNKFQKLSKLKETVPILNRSNVIYKINCSSCNDFYVGLTTRRLHKRLDEHKKREFCSVYKHNSQKDHIIDFENPKILATDHKKQRLQIKETLCINQCQAYKSLNVNIKSFECTLW